MRPPRLKLLAPSVVLSILVLIGSLFLSTVVATPAELKNVRFGLPISYVTQDFSRYDPPASSFPRPYRLASPMEAPLRVDWIRFGASWLIIFVACQLAVALISLVAPRTEAQG